MPKFQGYLNQASRTLYVGLPQQFQFTLTLGAHQSAQLWLNTDSSRQQGLLLSFNAQQHQLRINQQVYAWPQRLQFQSDQKWLRWDHVKVAYPTQATQRLLILQSQQTSLDYQLDLTY